MMAAHVILDTILLVCSNFCEGAWKCFLIFLGATQSRARINLFKLFVLVACLGYSSIVMTLHMGQGIQEWTK